MLVKRIILIVVTALIIGLTAFVAGKSLDQINWEVEIGRALSGDVSAAGEELENVLPEGEFASPAE